MPGVMCPKCGCYMGPGGHSCESEKAPGSKPGPQSEDREGGKEGDFAQKALKPVD